ncbi:hypothetical protein BJ944DRAFT_264854 [Cunninghamella echinulata]|nr:hypothetical protein BJ944DRAFT_264854 [Cunninghamella echinulata]
MELRVRMGICRIYLGQPKVAARHFEYLYQHTPKAYPDLYQDVAYAYMDRRFYETALPLFQKIINAEDEVEVELLIKTADCYRQVGDFDTAVIFYVNVLDEQPENLEVMTSLALVYEQQGKEDEAFELANFVVEKTRELRKQKRMEALALKKNKEQQQHNDDNNNDNDEDIMDEDDDRMESTNDIATEATKRLQFSSSKKQASLFDENKHDKRLQKNSLREKLRREEELKQFKALDLYETIVNLDQSLNDEIIHTDRNVMRDYIYAAQQLWSDFSSVSAFFDSKKFKKENPDGGFFAARKSIRKIFFSSREAKSVTTRLNKKRDRNTQNNTNLDSDEDEDDEDEDDVTEEESSSKKDITQTIHFRNILIDDYVRIFINLCYMLTVLYRGDEAINILRTLAESKVVYFHEKRSQYIMLALLGCSILHKDKRNALIACRWFCNAFKFKKEGYKIYNASFNSGWEDKLSYASATAFKFFSRHVKLMDKLYILYQKQLISNATDGNEEEARKQIEQLKKDIETLNSESMNVNDNDNEDNLLGLFEKGNKSNGLEDSKPLERLDTYLLTLYGHVMAIGKNYVNSIAFYLRTYAIAPENPLNTLCLGIAHLQRSTQRKTDNRHLQVIKGMNMFSNYCKLRNYNQEAEYNMGRAFHLIGITHLAVRHYERALSLPSAAKEGIKKPTPIEDIYVWPISEEEEDNGDDEEYDPTDLKYEAAYNLHLIYMTSGATALAQIVLLKYCTI